MLLKPGQQVTVGELIVRHDALRVTDDGQKQMITAHVTVLRDGKEIGDDVSGQVVLPQAARTSRPPRWRSAAASREDLYIVLPALRGRRPDGDARVWLNAAGELDLDRLRRPRDRHRASRSCRTRSSRSPSRVAGCRSGDDGGDPAGARPGRWPCWRRAIGVSADRKKLTQRSSRGAIMCTCGGCRRPRRRLRHVELRRARRCSRPSFSELIAEGKSDDAILAIFVRDAGGQDVLAAPPTAASTVWRGCSYTLGARRTVGIIMTARRWSRPTAGTRGRCGGTGCRLNARLDDELRDLD